MKKSKVLLGLAAAAATLLFATACSESGSKDSSDGKKTIYFIPTVDTGAYWSPMKRGAQETAEKLGYNLVVKTATSTEAGKNDKHIGFVKEAISAKAAGIAISPMEPNIFQPVVEDAMNAKIPVITFDAEIADPSKRTAYVGTVNEKAGFKLGEEAGKEMKAAGVTKGSIETMCTDVSQTTNIDRLKGLKAGFKSAMGDDYKNFEWLEPQMDNDQAATSKTITEGLITAHSDLAVIFTFGSEGPDVGVMEALASQKKAGKIYHYGFDYTPTWEKGIEEGRINGIVDQDAYNIGVQVITNLDKAIKGEKLDSVIPIDVNYVPAGEIVTYGEKKEK
ncbi:D-ribose ABC transporter substrate-binding protein [Lactococcus hodotermopsidis]|uniref:D-ribose ABC transporter substrate-binding protein n=1 Tax=Pseudolactococcus hodotermopsidis TaxID=2709157 RepID=A0A6A0B9D6_9LACT|nr:sugar ABC transporter substrate-binding protein [Lactococcus hodotermopsidis]GFH42050.1 D-ribose ABC transporter substrate-binding protein [Lactococcus hodotermopsidis]